LNTFFRIAIFLALGMIMFNLSVAFVNGLGIFDSSEAVGTGTIEGEDAIDTLSGGEFTGIDNIWDLALYGSIIGGVSAVTLAFLTHSTTPIGIYLFGAIFWTSYLSTFTIFSTGGYIPIDFLNLFHVGSILLFVAAVIGMLTGSG